MAKVNKASSTVALSNDANGSWGGYNILPAESSVQISKAAESYTTEEVNWVSKLIVPKEGLVQAKVTDTVPSRYLSEELGTHTDLYEEGSLVIEDLLEGETYTVDTSDPTKVVITFYQDAGKTITGLRESDSARTVTIRLTTKVDQEWLEFGKTITDPGYLYLKNHINTIKIEGKEATATVSFDDITKDCEAITSGGKVTSLKYTVVLAGVLSEPVIIEDKFDRDILEVDTAPTDTWYHMHIFGGSQWSQDLGRTAISYTDSSDGIILNAASVPKDANGNYYSHYKIVYYLKLKDGVDLDQLAISNGGKYDIVNTAKWGDHETTCTYETRYDYLDKELLNAV